MSAETHELTDAIDFRELLDDINLAMVALSPEWSVHYHNTASLTYFDESEPDGELFWDVLETDFKCCLETAYKKALLGEQDQLNIEESSNRERTAPVDVYDDVPLNLLDQKAVSFEFQCEKTGRSYSCNFDLHRGNLLFRIEDITSLIQARERAETARSELEEALDRMKEARNAQPLTGLPGNVSIQEEMKQRLNSDRVFALIYVDLDHFKPFNDRYGFERGNEVLLFLRDILEEALERFPSDQNFLGHVGGDDFVIMTSTDHYEELCQWIIDEFDREIPSFYDRKDREEGGIVTKNRQGEEQEFHFMTISLAVVTNDNRTFENHLEMSEEAASVKKLAKKSRDTSCYRVDRRTD